MLLQAWRDLKRQESLSESSMASINTNLQAQQAQNALTVSNRQLNTAVNQLSTGLRVNSAADDAASLAIGNRMQTRVLSLNQTIRNANDGITMIQTADSAVQSLSESLYRMNELAIQASNDTNGTSDRTALNTEFAQLQAGMTSIINGTTWNGMGLLNSTATYNYQVGASGSTTDAVSVTFTSLTSLTALSANGVNTSANASLAITAVASSLTTLNSNRSVWGAAINRLTYAADNSANVSMNLSASKSQLMDTDYAKTTANLARAQILQDAGTAMLSQANQQSYTVLQLLN
jgi:flagellin